MYCDAKLCTGCRACELVCSGAQERVFNPSKARIRVVRMEPTLDVAIVCPQCENPPCALACPTGAIRKLRTGVVEVDASRCVGCSVCVEACPFGAVTVVEGKAIKCDLCRGDPACVKQCTPGALRFVERVQVAQMRRLASVR